MSTAIQLPAPPASSCPARYCSKHPQERVVGVCSACLANKLSSLIHSSIVFAPEILDSSCTRAPPLRNSPPPRSIQTPSNHHYPDQDHRQTIDEEAESSAQRDKKEGFLSSCSKASLTPAEGYAEAELISDNSKVHEFVVQASLCREEGEHLIEEEKPSIHQDISSIDCSFLEGGKPETNPYLRANKPIKYKRIKSLCASRGESLSKLEREAHALASAASIQGDERGTGAKKVTLLTLFQSDDEDKWKNRALLDSELCKCTFSVDNKLVDEESVGGAVFKSKTIEEAKDVHRDSRCVPSASSVCPTVPDTLKHSALLNSLLCRKGGDDKKGRGSIRRPCQVNEPSRTYLMRTFHEGGLPQPVRDDGGFIRATYIASESRDQALRRCKSKSERFITRSSVSSSQPEDESPPSLAHGIDTKSERKFNLSARVLAAELPFFLSSSAEAMAMSPSRAGNRSSRTTQVKDCEEVLSRLHEECHLARNTSLLEWEIGEVMVESGPFPVCRSKAQDNEEVESVEMLISECLNANFRSVSEARAADATGMVAFMARANQEEAHEGNFVTDEAQEVSQSLGSSASLGKFVAGASAAAGQQGVNKNKLTEEFKQGGGWEAYSSKSGRGGCRWPSSSSKAVKIAPAQSGLLRFYLITPLRNRGRARFTATHRLPKRPFWPAMFI